VCDILSRAYISVLKGFAATLSLLAMSSAAAAPAGAVYANSASFSSPVLAHQQLAQVRGSERNTRSSDSGAPVQPSASAEDALRSIRFITRAKFIVMPVFDKSGSSMQYGSAGGSMTTTNEFATEVLNDSIREAGATTISWFKVNSAMNKKFGQTGLNRADLTNDAFIPELMEVGKTLGARYIIRPVILNQTDSSSTETRANPAAFVPVVGMFARSTKTKTKSSATVTLKIDIISIKEEDIIGAKRFEGAVRDEKTSSGYSYSYGASSSTGGMSAMAKGALYDAIFQAVDFISDKVD
tara:strand:+ start:100 stop:990 length:891 start_codon:yes stop_codon:yes gene_type:complete